MLYDLVPPLIFFGSVGGIIVLIARILARIRRARFSASISSVATEDEGRLTRRLKPPRHTIYLIGSRVGLWLQRIGQLGGKVRQGLSWLGSKMTGQTALMRQRLMAAVAAALRRGAASLSRRRLRRQLGGRLPATPSPLLPSDNTVTPPALTPAPPAVAVVADPVFKTTPVQGEEEPPRLKPTRVFSPSFFKKTPPISALETARAAYNEEQYDQVESILVPYIFEHTSDTAAYMLLGQAALGQENWDEAIEIFEQVLTLHPEEPGAHAALGYAAYRGGKFAKALPALQRAHDQNPADEKVLEYLLEIARKMDNQALQNSIKAEMVALKT